MKFAVNIFFALLSARLTIGEILADYLVSTNFSDYVESREHTAVMFYAPWCKHSQTFLPVWDHLAQHFESKNVGITKVDCLADKDLYWQHKIEGFPTIKLFFGSGSKIEPIPFTGERDFETVSNFIENMKQTSLVSAGLTLEEYPALVSQHLTPLKSILVLFVKEHGDAVDYLEYTCKMMSNVVCAVSSDSNLLESFGVSDFGGNALVLVRDFADELSVVHAPNKATKSAEEMLVWSRSHSYPLLVEFSPDNEAVLFNSDRPGYNIHVVSVVDSQLDSFPQIKSDLLSVALDFIGVYTFVYIDVSNPSDYVENILDDLQLTRTSAPTAMIVKSMKTKVQFYRLHGGTDLNQESMNQWVSEFQQNNLPPTRTIELGSESHDEL